ncbi:hypothetical protein AHYW_000452 [Providencia manganoxydans]|uniref:N-acetylmuramoyl-L-alanine amidase-like domain-containing protein n=1 Tax=Providencia TaxID=586 RepID=UPI001124880F|nr:N-acetylmuramoyl-L-alanine amidase-like domain-containing protein [Providencia stuartii]
MLKRLMAVALLFISSMSCAVSVVLEPGSLFILNNIQRDTVGLTSELRVKVITEKLLGTPYNNHTLNSQATAEEKLIINLKSMDCMTFIEYTEAFKRSDDYDDFIQNLEKIRYSENGISYVTRRHFFTDWLQQADSSISDVTQQISPNSILVNKTLNRKNNGQLLIQDLPITNRLIRYIPTKHIDNSVLGAIKTGDYIGVYSSKPELDVSHVGIAIRQGEKVYFRNASSIKRVLKVSDVDLKQYLQGKTGIVVLRSQFGQLD